jgi:hypothetical protein
VKSARSDKLTAKPTPHARPFTMPVRAENSANGTAALGEGGMVRAWVRFWFTPADPIGLHIVRMLTGLLLLAWLLLTYRTQLDGFLGLNGWVDAKAFSEAGRLPEGLFTPSWSVLYLLGADPAWMRIVFWASVAVLAAFAIGVLPRLTAILTWVIVASFTANPAFEYEGDALLQMLAFYLMVGYLFCGLMHSSGELRSRLLGPILAWPLRRRASEESGQPQPSLVANVALRLLQVHLALIFVTSGLHKLQFGDWWAGVALWFPLHPPFETTLAEAQANKAHAELYLSLLNIGAYATMAWQIGFPLFAWRPRWRPALLGGAFIGLLAGAFFWRLPIIGPALFIGCLAFVTPAEWQRVLAWLPARRPTASIAQPEEMATLVPAGQRG